MQNGDIEMCSTHNEGKSVVAARFIWTLKNKVYNYDFNFKKYVYWSIRWFS